MPNQDVAELEEGLDLSTVRMLHTLGQMRNAQVESPQYISSHNRIMLPSGLEFSREDEFDRKQQPELEILRDNESIISQLDRSEYFSARDASRNQSAIEEEEIASDLARNLYSVPQPENSVYFIRRDVSKQKTERLKEINSLLPIINKESLFSDGEENKKISLFENENSFPYSQYTSIRENILRIEEEAEGRGENTGEFLRRCGVNPEIYTNLRNAFSQKGYGPEFFDQQAQLIVGLPSPGLSIALQAFDEGESAAFATTHLKQFIKEGQTVSEEDLLRYDIQLDIRTNGSHFGKQMRGKYFDTMYNFCLIHDGVLIASVGFDAIKGGIQINQIQGIKGHGDQLKPFKWERALVSYALQWAEQNGVEEVRVVSVDNNKWENVYGHLDKSQGKMLYDVTAQRVRYKGRKFERGRITGDYVMRFDGDYSGLQNRVDIVPKSCLPVAV